MNDAPRTRDPEKTRRRLLEGAAQAVIQHGTTASLESIARRAGVSKGGLLHHFQSKDELFIALAEHLLDDFRAEVDAQTDPQDLAPGRLVRAYIRATLHQLEAATIRDEATLMAALSAIPQVVRRAHSDGQAWRERLGADGLDPTRTAILTRAADGAAAAALFEGQLDQEQIALLRDELIALSYATEPLDGRSSGHEARRR